MHTLEVLVGTSIVLILTFATSVPFVRELRALIDMTKRITRLIIPHISTKITAPVAKPRLRNPQTIPTHTLSITLTPTIVSSPPTHLDLSPSLVLTPLEPRKLSFGASLVRGLVITTYRQPLLSKKSVHYLTVLLPINNIKLFQYSLLNNKRKIQLKNRRKNPSHSQSIVWFLYDLNNRSRLCCISLVLPAFYRCRSMILSALSLCSFSRLLRFYSNLLFLRSSLAPFHDLLGRSFA